MGLTRYRRSAFSPDALAAFDHTMDEVWTELLADGLLSSSNFDASKTRARVAQKLIEFASSGWSAIQIKQLILRTLRNERLAARHKIRYRGGWRPHS